MLSFVIGIAGWYALSSAGCNTYNYWRIFFVSQNAELEVSKSQRAEMKSTYCAQAQPVAKHLVSLVQLNKMLSEGSLNGATVIQCP